MRIMITAQASGSGKTAVTCGLIAALKKRGLKTSAFKCGPDYIDPMFHRSVLGVSSHNLDIFLAGEEGVRRVFAKAASGIDALVCEGVMGYYDGLGGSDAKASAWHLSTLLDIPTVLVLRPKGSALTMAAVIKGMATFREPSNIKAVILNDCSKSYFDNYARLLEEEGGLPVLGYLPHMEEAVLESRHLGLMTAGEIGDIRDRIDRIAEVMEETMDLDRLMELGGGLSAGAAGEPDGECGGADMDLESKPLTDGDAFEDGSPLIAVAKDQAFCFTYQETLEALEEAGAKLKYFSPINDKNLPEGISGIYLPGGYPELYAQELSKNDSMRKEIKEAIASGLPTVAECGGFLYLGRELEDENGNIWDMVDAFPGSAKNAGHLVRFGYGRISAKEDSMLLRSGEEFPVHEFHYWDSTENGSDMHLVKASNGVEYAFGFCNDRLYAGFPHLYMGGGAPLAKRFVETAEKFARESSGERQ